LKPLSLAFAAAALSLAACSGSGESLSDKEFGRKVRAYLIANPEVLQEASQALAVKQQKQQLENFKKAVGRNRAAIERDPRDFVANPNGTITVTEFYDYNCGYCKLISPQIVQLIRENPDVRFVFKEYTIFGALSERAARAALLAKDNGRYVAVHAALMAEKPLTEAAIDRILTANGIDPARLSDPALTSRLNRQLADIQGLAMALGLEGTPAFVVGDTLIPGADMDALKQAISAERRRR